MAASDIGSGISVDQADLHMPPEPEDGETENAAMTLIEHLEELRHRLIYVIIAIAVTSVVSFIFWSPILDFLLLPLPSYANSLHGVTGGKLVVTGLVEPFLVALKLAMAVGISLASPVILYQLWGFIAPGLTRNEKKYAKPFTILGVALFVVGLAVGFVTLRYPVNWLVDFGKGQFTLLVDASSYFTFVAYFLLAFGIVFELPLVVTFLGIVGVVNSRTLRQRRMYILFGLWFLSCIITPGADPYSPLIIAVAFTALFELSVVLLRILHK
jgi:sec-independent protein translocase protein TatC